MRFPSPLSCIAIAAVVLVAQPLFASAGPDISGEWLRSDGTLRVNIAACGSQICAINTWIKDTNRVDQVGDKLIMTLEAQGDSRLIGAAFDVRRNQSYSLNITIDRNTMLTQGCMVQGVLCKTMSWNRSR
jgi:uncharacterized protein (DUF2147 family)